jgi:hypothetical protein
MPNTCAPSILVHSSPLLNPVSSTLSNIMNGWPTTIHGCECVLAQNLLPPTLLQNIWILTSPTHPPTLWDVYVCVVCMCVHLRLSLLHLCFSLSFSNCFPHPCLSGGLRAQAPFADTETLKIRRFCFWVFFFVLFCFLSNPKILF